MDPTMLSSTDSPQETRLSPRRVTAAIVVSMLVVMGSLALLSSPHLQNNAASTTDLAVTTPTATGKGAQSGGQGAHTPICDTVGAAVEVDGTPLGVPGIGGPGATKGGCPCKAKFPSLTGIGFSDSEDCGGLIGMNNCVRTNPDQENGFCVLNCTVSGFTVTDDSVTTQHLSHSKQNGCGCMKGWDCTSGFCDPDFAGDSTGAQSKGDAGLCRPMKYGIGGIVAMSGCSKTGCSCKKPGDCESPNACEAGVCTVRTPDAATQPLKLGMKCTDGWSCASGNCLVGVCRAKAINIPGVCVYQGCACKHQEDCSPRFSKAGPTVACQDGTCTLQCTRQVPAARGPPPHLHNKQFNGCVCEKTSDCCSGICGVGPHAKAGDQTVCKRNPPVKKGCIAELLILTPWCGEPGANPFSGKVAPWCQEWFDGECPGKYGAFC